MGGHEPQPLPEVVFKVIDDPNILLPVGVADKQAVAFGFNSGEWAGKEGKDGQEVEGRYQRWLQPMESDLARQVEYDMDEQDQVWLDNVNKERARERQSPVSYEVFEIIFDKLEKEYFDLTKRIPKRQSAMPNEDSKCAICDDGECENSNAIVFCDGCNLAVHQDCYGVPYIPEGQWLCRKCTVSPDKPVTCVLCPNSYGAFKQTTTGQWAHLLCAIWVPDTGVSNTVYMEPIDGVENISKNRWKLVCYLCRKRVGACIQCANRNCFTAFHVTCARERGLELKMKQGTERGELRPYCEKHSEGFVAPESAHASSSDAPGHGGHNHKHSMVLSLKRSKLGHTLSFKHSAGASKSARAYKKTYSSGPPVVPAYVYDRVLDYVARVKLAKKPAFVSLICRYWSLKREARRGAPLLKRLHLEPWTASATSHQQTDVEKAKKLELIRLLRNDLEKVRMLTERVRKREKKKLERVQLFKTIMDDYVFPKDKVMRDVLQRIAQLDKQHFFARPVSRLQAPDYYDIIKAPMDWSTMHEKLDRHEYLTTQDFQDDVELVINNARRYNKKETSVHRSAVRVQEGAEPILAELEFLDSPDSEASQHTSNIANLLTPALVEELFDYHYDPPPPKLPKVLNNLKGKNKASDTPNGRKRNADLAGVEEGARSSPRTRAKPITEKDEMEATAATPVVSTRVNAREAARLRAEIAAVEGTPDQKRATRRKTGEGVDVEIEPAINGRSNTHTHTEQPTPLLVTDVDNRSSFKFFETGWVYPEGSSRRRRRVASTSTHNDSQVPIASTSNSNSKPVANEPLAPPPKSLVDVSQAPLPPRSHKGKQKAVEPAHVGENSAPLDSQDALADELPHDTEASNVAESSRKKPAVDGKKNRPEELKKNIAREMRDWEAKWKELAPKFAVTDLSQIPDGTLVWAKQIGFPTWPAEVADPDDPDSPQELVARRPKGEGSENLVLIQFFDEHGTGNWLPLKMLHLLGESTEFDEHCLSPGAVLRKSKSSTKSTKTVSSQVAQLRDAYTRACVNIELPSEVQAGADNEVTQTKKGRKGSRKR